MKYKRIEYSKNFNIMGTIHEKMCLDVELEDGDDPDQCFLQLKERVHKWANQRGFEIEERPKVQPSVAQTNGFKVEKPLSPKEKILQQITESSDLKVLESFKLLVRKDDELLDAYNLRVVELINIKKELA